MIEIFKSAVTSQYRAALMTLKQSIDRADEETWAVGHIDGPVNQVVFHTLFYADLYLHQSEDGFEDQKFHRDHAAYFRDYEEKADRLPVNFYDRSTTVEYLAHCMGKAPTVMAEETEASLSGASGFHWRPGSRAEHHIYNVRHIQHHAAQLGLRHQLLGGEPLSWVGRG
jgi:hypothetical protein